jgi:hypothetical protein
MEAYLEAIDVRCLRATTEGLPEIKDPANPVGDEEKYDQWNAKAKNALYQGLGKDIFNRVRNAKNAHKLWENLCALYERTKSEREKRYHIALKKIFEILPKESANDMYTRLNVLVEDLNALGLTQMSPSDVARRILSVLPIEKYGHIVTCFTKVISPPQYEHKYWERSMLMRCTCISLQKRAHHLPRRRTWLLKLAMTRKRRRDKP